MASKSKKPAKMANRNVGNNAPLKDDGERYMVISPAGKVIYPGKGVALAEAVRLAVGMVELTGIAKIGEGGELIPGTVRDDEFVAFAQSSTAQAQELAAA